MNLLGFCLPNLMVPIKGEKPNIILAELSKFNGKCTKYGLGVLEKNIQFCLKCLRFPTSRTFAPELNCRQQIELPTEANNYNCDFLLDLVSA